MKSDRQQSKGNVIACPHCGYEYPATGVFVLGEILGRPDSIVRDPLGKIIYMDGKESGEPQLLESLICDGCGKAFVVEATLGFKSRKQAEELDFSDTSVSLLD